MAIKIDADAAIRREVWKAQRQRARRLADKGAVVEYRPPYNAEALGLPTQRLLGQVVKLATTESSEWGPMVIIGYGPRKKRNGASFATYTYHKAVPAALCKEVRHG